MTKPKPLRWLHISDIHTGCPGREVWWNANEAFARSIGEMVARRGVPDLLLFTGDIAWQGQAEEYEKFDQLLKKLVTIQHPA
ncbi:MAG: metallophosphoesterase [Magnetococcales bacterium]|nr:metallophosphoesterase [Magnetococcales bacterium]